jgi:two-component system, cell cycle sensor histidine kinase and response regulator CckA
MESRPRPGSAATLDVEAPKMAGQNLAQMRAPIEQLADSNIIGILFVKPEGPVVYANDEFLRMVDYSREDLEAGRLDWRKMTPMEWSFATREAARQIEETRKAAPFEKEFFRKDGTRVPVLIGILGPAAPGAEALCFVLDLTERKQTEQDLDRLMIERFAMLDSVADGIFGLDMEGNCTFINPAALEMLGYEGEECVGRNMHDLIHYKSATGEPISRKACQVSNAVRKCVGMRADYDVAWRKDGTSFDVEYSSCPIVVNGHAEGSVISFKDISERKKAEADLRASEERFRGAFAHAAAGMSIANFEGRYLEVNEAFCRMTGYSEAELLARNFQAITHPDDLASSVDIVAQMRRKELPGFVMEKRQVRKDGSILWVRCSAAPLCDASGNPSRFVTILEDISERVQGRQQLDETAEWQRGISDNPAEKTPPQGVDDARRQLEAQIADVQNKDAAGHLAAAIAHDFNGLLTVILGQSALLAQRLGAEDPRSGNVAEIRKAGERAAALIANLRTVSKKPESRASVVSPNELIRDMEPILRSTLGSDVELGTRLDPGAGNIWADPAQMEEVILNLAINAHDAMPHGGRLEIESERWNPDSGLELPASLEPGAYVLLTFWDNGGGMDAETRARIFEPFFTTKEPSVASGLGLAAVAGIIAESGGAILVSSAIDQGTTFRIYLPLARERGELPAKLLIVDDDEQVRSVLTLLLESEGYVVVPASNGREAEGLCRKISPDLVITDVVMPDQDGLETIQTICRNWPHLPVIAISGVLASGYLEMAKKMGADAVMYKPIEREALLSEVRRLIAK